MSYQNKDHIYVKEKAVDSSLCDIAIHWLNTNQLVRNPNGFYNGYSQHIGDSEFRSILNIVHENLITYRDECYPFLQGMYCDWGMEHTFNLQKYKPGQSYNAEHMEHGNDANSCLRLLGWMVYLNDINDGGETYWPQQKFKKSARKGDLLIWPAGWTHSHYGIVSNTEYKYIITGWYSFNRLISHEERWEMEGKAVPE